MCARTTVDYSGQHCSLLRASPGQKCVKCVGSVQVNRQEDIESKTNGQTSRTDSADKQTDRETGR